MNEVKVSVSPFYTGTEWYDEGTGVVFTPTLTMYPYTFNKLDKDLSGVKNAVRLGRLILLTGTLDDVSVDLEKLDPTTLSKEQFNQIIESNKGSVDTESANKLVLANKEIVTLKKNLETEKANTNKEKLEKEDALTAKNLFFTTHTFVTEDLKNAFYTVNILKEILDAKKIAYETSDSKTVLKEKLIAGQV